MNSEIATNELQLNFLLRCAIQVVGRLSIPPDNVREVVASTKKHLKAYNLCDGTLTLSEVAKKAGLDTGNFSRTSDRWVENGVVFRVKQGKEIRLLHLYPIPETIKAKPK